MHRLLAPLVLTLVALGCDDGTTDTPADTGTTDTTTTDTGADPCTTHPSTCNLDSRNPEAPWDCCPSGTTCCPLCHDSGWCQLDYECLATCPETLPCTGTGAGEGLSCHYTPPLATTAYCPVPTTLNPTGAVPCVTTCGTGVECPFDATWGDAALCCPEATTCATSAFGLPMCE